MPTLVTLEGTIWRITSREELKNFCRQRAIDWHLESNLAQLLGLAIVGDGRSGGRERGGYFRLDTGSWFRHSSLDLHVPVFGSAPQKYKQLCEKYKVACSLATFKRLIEKPGRLSEDGWFCVEQPATVAQLANGSSVRNMPALQSQPAQQDRPQLPDFAACGDPQLEVCGAGSCSSASGSQEVSQGSNLAFARSCARCCAQISMVPTRSRAPVTRARRSILDLRRWSSMHCRAPRARVPQGVGAKK
jgi:hypothetical protein